MAEQYLIDAVRAHAMRYYNKDGWDYLVECWSDEDIADYIEGAENKATAIQNCHEVVLLLAEQRGSVMAEAF
jgi:hypothetical protein